MSELTEYATAEPARDGDSDSSETSSSSIIEYNIDEECDPIIRGDVVPEPKNYKYGLTSRNSRDTNAIRRSLIHAIRNHLSYANLPSVIELCGDVADPRDSVFAKARHACLIMSNTIPELDASKPDQVPYCIWYPRVATEETYRQVAIKYPMLKYQVGRACAVAGYTKLYQELGLLPEVSIAEEARESPHGKAIFEDIMSHPVRYSVFNDYERCVRDIPVVNASLNGDTAVLLSINQACPPNYVSMNSRRYFDIAEDGGICESTLTGKKTTGFGTDNSHTAGAESVGESRSKSITNEEFRREDAWLLYRPLPKDLPPINKDLLILQAAFEGNVDRYHRLRRPMMIELEWECVIRGIYHSTPFAKWWTTLPDCKDAFRAAAHARFTMINDVSWLRSKGDVIPPSYMIWWPIQPKEETLRILLKLEPRSKLQVAHAAIACNFQALYDEIQITPNRTLLQEALVRNRPYYQKDLEARATSDFPWSRNQHGDTDSTYETTEEIKEERSTEIYESICSLTLGGEILGGIYGYNILEITSVDLFISSTEEFLAKVEQLGGVQNAPYAVLNWSDS